MCDNVRTRSYLPLLATLDERQRSEAQNDFTLEFFDCAFSQSYSQLDRDERVDCVYDAFLKIFAAAPVLPDLTGGYIHGAVHNQCRNCWLRHQRRPKTVPLSGAKVPPAADQPTDELAEVFEIFDAAGLTPTEKAVVRLKVVEDRSWEEVAVLLEMTVSQARHTLARALEKLRRWRGEQGE